MKPDNKDFINSVNLNIHTDFPYLILNVKNDVAVPRNPGFHVMHWHEDLQFIYVLEEMVLQELFVSGLFCFFLHGQSRRQTYGSVYRKSADYRCFSGKCSLAYLYFRAFAKTHFTGRK